MKYKDYARAVPQVLFALVINGLLIYGTRTQPLVAGFAWTTGASLGLLLIAILTSTVLVFQDGKEGVCVRAMWRLMPWCVTTLYAGYGAFVLLYIFGVLP